MMTGFNKNDYLQYRFGLRRLAHYFTEQARNDPRLDEKAPDFDQYISEEERQLKLGLRGYTLKMASSFAVCAGALGALALGGAVPMIVVIPALAACAAADLAGTAMGVRAVQRSQVLSEKRVAAKPALTMVR